MRPPLTQTQLDGVSFLLQRRRAILADDVGVGKTVQSLTAIWTEDAFPLLVVCPNHLKESVWIPEITKWLPNTVTINKFPNSHVRTRRIRSLYNTKWDVLLVSPDQLRVHLNELAQHSFKGIVVDEAHKFSNPKALQTKALFALTKAIDPKFLFLLTATPIRNRTDDVWSLLHLIDPITYRSKRTWCQLHLNEVELYTTHYVLTQFTTPKDPEAFKGMLGSHLLKRERELTESPKAAPPQIIQLDMYPKQREAYDQMLNSWWVDIDEGREIGAANALARSVRLSQICTSQDLIDTESKIIRGPKFDFIEDLVEGTNEQVYIVAESAVALERFHKRHPKWSCWTGTYGNMNKALGDFQGGKTQVLMTTYRLGGEGHNLQCASVIVFLELNWVPANIHQAIGRLTRHGQTKVVQPYFLMARDSIDDLVYRTLEDKKEIINVSIPPYERTMMLLKRP